MVKEQYLHSNEEFFQTAVKLVNFQDTKASAEAISTWVENKTDGKNSRCSFLSLFALLYWLVKSWCFLQSPGVVVRRAFVWKKIGLACIHLILLKLGVISLQRGLSSEVSILCSCTLTCHCTGASVTTYTLSLWVRYPPGRVEPPKLPWILYKTRLSWQHWLSPVRWSLHV